MIELCILLTAVAIVCAVPLAYGLGVLAMLIWDGWRHRRNARRRRQ